MLTVGAHCPAMVVVMGFDGVYMVLLVVVMDLFLRGIKIITFLGREGYVVFTVGVGDPGGDGESKLNWLQ